MRKILLTTLLLASAFVAGAADGLRVKTLTGDAVMFHFDSRPEVTFLAGKLQVKTAADPAVTFELDDIDSIEFATMTGADAPAGSGICMSADASGVVFGNIADGAHAAVYSISGRLLVSERCAGGNFSLSRSVYGPGVYIVKIDGFTAKIVL